MALLEQMDAQPPAPDLQVAGPRRAARLAVTARRGRRAEAAKDRPAPRVKYEVQWLDAEEEDPPARRSG